MKNYIRICVKGVNINRLYKTLKKNDIEMFDICRKDHNTVEFSLLQNKHKKLLNLLKNSSYKIDVLKYGGFSKIYHFFIKRFGFLIGAVIGIFIITVSNFFITDIKIFGNEKLNHTDIIALLNNNGIKKGVSTNISTDNIKSLLNSNFNDISLVSVIKKGTTIIINIKEKQSLDKIDNIS